MLCGLFINLTKNHKMTCIRLFFPILELASTCSCLFLWSEHFFFFFQMYHDLNLPYFFTFEELNSRYPGVNDTEFKADLVL